jgi:uncharacterized membrane protein
VLAVLAITFLLSISILPNITLVMKKPYSPGFLDALTAIGIIVALYGIIAAVALVA